jgi:hypothetical protein
MSSVACVAREVAHGLSAYLCGTSSRFLRSARSIDPASIAARHRLISISSVDGSSVSLGVARWDPDGDTGALRDTLASALSLPGVLDLIVFGSQARGGTTGYSDLDAMLLLDDVVADDAARMRSLRPYVLAAGRAVLAYQPMQHHGFLVCTPRLLHHASAALGMPAEAFGETASLLGAGAEASFAVTSDRRRPFRKLAETLLLTRSWPRHPWNLHLRLSMFELVPVLYLQASGRVTEKHRSFVEARREFGDGWWPYDVLDEVRRRWPRQRRPGVRVLSTLLRNPWLALAAWRRVPVVRSAEQVRVLLTPECLRGLQSLISKMLERVG